MHTRIETITPEKAQEYLQKNKNNRVLRQKHVEFLAGEIRNGNWVTTHQGIAFSDTGDLIDGQHRLAAITKAGVPAQMLVTSGVTANGKSFKAQDIIDRGALRSLADQLSISTGLKNAFITTAAVRWIVKVFMNHANATVSAGNVLEILGMYGEQIAEVYQRVAPTDVFKKGWILGSLAIAAKAEGQKMYDIADKLGHGNDLSSGDPILALRNWLINKYGGDRGIEARTNKEQFFNGLYHAVLGGELKRVHIGGRGLEYFISKQQEEVGRIREMFGVQREFAVITLHGKSKKSGKKKEA